MRKAFPHSLTAHADSRQFRLGINKFINNNMNRVAKKRKRREKRNAQKKVKHTKREECVAK